MNALFARLMKDESGFVVSAELVLVATIAVLAMVVGLAEVAMNVNQELEDVSAAFGASNQSFVVNGACGHIGQFGGSIYEDRADFCDNAGDIIPGSSIDYEY